MADQPEELQIREWRYDQQDPAEEAKERKTKKKQTSNLDENFLKQIFPC